MRYNIAAVKPKDEKIELIWCFEGLKTIVRELQKWKGETKTAGKGKGDVFEECPEGENSELWMWMLT